ncbi:MAG TPA: DUF2461 domain-containing protein [Pelobium sp.]
MTTISPQTFHFLNQLKQNNNRDWFQDNKSAYLAAKENVEAFADEIIDSFKILNPYVSPDLTGKKSVKRIYRDVRFSKNKDPYKSNFGISIPTSAKGIHGPGFFIQIEPDCSFVAGGMWMPESEHLKLIRQEIDYSADKLNEILGKSSFKSFFANGLQQTDKLKTTPKGYDASNPNIELLKLKSFTVASFFSDKALQTKDASDEIVRCLKEIIPLNKFLQEAIATE